MTSSIRERSASPRPTVSIDPDQRLRGMIHDELRELVAIRHDLHQHPELSFQEQRTSGIVQRELTKLSIRHKTGLGKGTGVLAHLPATRPEHNQRPAVALRADMDALPIVEQTGKPYASTTKGVMHACGHDGHTTMLIGVARVLAKLERPNPVTLIFQPAEEGGGGGEVMVQEGVLEGEGQFQSRTGPRPGRGLGSSVGRVFGLHGWPTVTVGAVASRPGPMLANTDDFVVVIRGVQAHAAYPHFGRDPIVAASHVVVALQTIASRSFGPLENVVVTVGQINAGTANNIIPETCTIIGTVRTLSDRTRALARERFFAIVQQTAMSMGCSAEIDWQDGYPAVLNDAAMTDHFFAIAREAIGAERAQLMPEPSMGGEDFAYFSREVPGCFFALGLRPRQAEHFPSLHQPDFDFNDEAIPTGVELLCRLALAEA
ncbi:MAG: M20 family metallopeptidase [Planctomycetota bacterium]|nr:M20 family metallopeptidase [Planctomycetota bacterium]